jgi:hypothetical protein
MRSVPGNRNHGSASEPDKGRPATAISPALIAYLANLGLGLLASLGIL